MAKHVVVIERITAVRITVEADDLDQAKDRAIDEYNAGRYQLDSVDFTAEVARVQPPLTPEVLDFEVEESGDARVVHLARKPPEEDLCPRCGADISKKIRAVRGEALIEAMSQKKREMIEALKVPPEFLGHRPVVFDPTTLRSILDIRRTAFIEISYDNTETWIDIELEKAVALLFSSYRDDASDRIDEQWRGLHVLVTDKAGSDGTAILRIKPSERRDIFVGRLSDLSSSLGLYIEQSSVNYAGVPRVRDVLEPGPADECPDPNGSYTIDEETGIIEWENPTKES